MTRTTISIWTALFALLMTAPAIAADPAMPGVEGRQQVQQRRIGQGVASGQLTPRETVRLEREQARIERTQRRMKADGVVTPGERARLHVRQDKASRDIDRAKHNARTAR